MVPPSIQHILKQKINKSHLYNVFIAYKLILFFCRIVKNWFNNQIPLKIGSESGFGGENLESGSGKKVCIQSDSDPQYLFRYTTFYVQDYQLLTRKKTTGPPEDKDISKCHKEEINLTKGGNAKENWRKIKDIGDGKVVKLMQNGKQRQKNGCLRSKYSLSGQGKTKISEKKAKKKFSGQSLDPHTNNNNQVTI
jgi:hypothetical protein